MLYSVADAVVFFHRWRYSLVNAPGGSRLTTINGLYGYYLLPAWFCRCCACLRHASLFSLFECAPNIQPVFPSLRYFCYLRRARAAWRRRGGRLTALCISLRLWPVALHAAAPPSLYALIGRCAADDMVLGGLGDASCKRWRLRTQAHWVSRTDGSACCDEGRLWCSLRARTTAVRGHSRISKRSWAWRAGGAFLNIPSVLRDKTWTGGRAVWTSTAKTCYRHAPFVLCGGRTLLLLPPQHPRAARALCQRASHCPTILVGTWQRACRRSR